MQDDNLYQQFSILETEELINIYGNSAKALLDRGMLSTTKKELQRILKEKRKREQIIDYVTPESYSNRGKVKRLSNHSILIDFLNEDWTFLFNGDYDNERKYYVYYHSDMTKGACRFRKGDKSIVFKGRPFYIGKGCGDRYKSKKRGRDHLSIINSLNESGFDDDSIFHIFKDNLTELEALELEAKLITFFGCSSELSQKKAHFHGMKGGWLINSDPSIRPGDVSLMMKIRGEK